MRIKSILSLVALFLLSALLQSQSNKVLTLEDAVLKAYSDLSPRRLNGLEWLNDRAYIYKKGKGMDEVVVLSDLKKNTESELITYSSLSQMLAPFKLELKSMPSFTRLADNLLVFQISSAYFLYDADKNKCLSFENETEGISDVHFSSDGMSMAYVKDNNVFVKSLKSEVRQITTEVTTDIVYGKTASRNEFGITDGIFWSPDNKSIAYYRNDQSAVTTYPLVDLNTLPVALSPIKYPMAGGPTEKVTIEVSDAAGKRISLKTKAEEDSYLCSVNWTPNGKQIILVILNRDQNHARYQRYDALTGEFLAIEYEEKDEKYVEPLFPLIFTDNEGKEFIYLSQKDGWMHAYHRKGNMESQLTKGNFVLTAYLGRNEEKNLYYFEGTAEDPTENHIYKVDLGRSEVTRISKNQGTYHARLSPSGNSMFTFFSSLDTPGKVILADGEGMVIKTLLQSADPLENYKVSRPELINITNRDGLILRARIIKPSEFDGSKKYPVLVYVYNGPHVQLVKNQWWAAAPLWMNYLAEQGYIVFTVDGRGSYNRGKDFEQSVFRHLGENEMNDQLDAVSYLKSLPYIDKDRLALHGWSYGGFMTASLMLKHPSVFKVGVAGGPVTNWKFYEVMYTERYMDTPETNEEGYKNSDLSNFTGNLNGKLLLIHGLSDDVVVPMHNFSLIKKFVDDGKQVDFFPYPGHPHNVGGKDRLHLMNKVIGYIEENINR